MKTINELNAALGVRVVQFSSPGWVEHRELRLGRAGGQNARRGTAGAKLHLLDVKVVVEKPDTNPRTFKVGAFSSIQGCTTGNGQFTGTVVPELVNLDAVNCIRCRRRLDAMLAKLEADAAAK